MTEKKELDSKKEAESQKDQSASESARVTLSGGLDAPEAASETTIEVESEKNLQDSILDDDRSALDELAEGDGKVVDRVVHISRVAKVVKGGRRFSFSALVVSGNGQGEVGFGLGKANEVPDAIRKGSEKARKNMIQIPIHNKTIPHDVIGHFGAGRVMMKKASPGTGVIAGGAVRAVFESAGIHDILAKCIGTSNPHNVVRAAFAGLSELQDPKKRKLELLSGQ